MKRYIQNSQQSHTLRYKAGVPAEINKAFKARRIDAAFISSIASRKCRCLDLGILARKKVQSVLLLPGNTQDDNESATSNVLAKVLNLQGQVLIGDKALKHYLQHDDDAVDLAELWYERQNLPFVFARLCYHSDSKKYKKLSKAFLRSSQKIPQYILLKASARTQIAQKDILEYLTLIEYRLDPHAKLSLRRFLRLAGKL